MDNVPIQTGPPEPRVTTASRKLMMAKAAGACLLVIGTTVGLLATVGIRGGAGSSDAPRSHIPDEGHPLKIGPTAERLLPMSPEEYQQCNVLIGLPPKGPYEISQFVHVLRAHGLEGKLEGDPDSCRTALNALLDDALGKRYFGAPPMVATRHGLRYSRVIGDEDVKEYHRDQLLAGLAELGVPLSHPLRIGESDFSVRAILDDSISNFYAQQRDLEWTAIAYVLYLPPRRQWANRFGERTTFDGLAELLLSTPPQSGSCGGLHIVYALSLFVRANQQIPILSKSMSARLSRHLRETVEGALETQQADGSWRVDWNLVDETRPVGNYPYPPDSALGRLLATGHMAEWFLYLPAELRDTERVRGALRLAGLWLLARCKTATPQDVWRATCPYTHAACVLKQIGYVSERPCGGASN